VKNATFSGENISQITTLTPARHLLGFLQVQDLDRLVGKLRIQALHANQKLPFGAGRSLGKVSGVSLFQTKKMRLNGNSKN
jgi:hypothetical protein